MARLISSPLGLRTVGLDILSGPRTVGQAETQTIGGFLQTVAAPFGLWRLRYSVRPLKGQMLRRYRGWITSLHGGANATRWTFCDWDGLSRTQRGISGSVDQNWSNGKPWSNGKDWHAYAPLVAIAAAAALGDTQVSLANSTWGQTLGEGDFLGFMPLHFGLYTVTEVMEPGTYRIWPPLRKVLTAADYATLNPVLAMRLEGESAAPYSRGPSLADNLQFTLVEALDDDVRSYFAD